MTLRRRHKREKGAGGEPRGVEAPAGTQPKEGQVVGEQDNQHEDEMARFLARIQGNPHHAELMRQKITLKATGAEMPLHEAHALLVRLRDMQERKPDQFVTLVALVKPKGIRYPAGQVSPKALAGLKKHGVIDKDGSPEQRIAAILDAAYVETKEGVVLRDPIIYPGREFVDELTRLDGELELQIGRALREEIEEERRNKRGKDDGPSR
jgi:hypothetical protein